MTQKRGLNRGLESLLPDVFGITLDRPSDRASKSSSIKKKPAKQKSNSPKNKSEQEKSNKEKLSKAKQTKEKLITTQKQIKDNLNQEKLNQEKLNQEKTKDTSSKNKNESNITNPSNAANPSNTVHPSDTDSTSNTATQDNLVMWDVEKLEPSRFQPRRDILDSDIEPLAESIKSQGIIQPLVIRKSAFGRGEIIAGERRWRAAKLAGLKHVPVIVKDVEDKACMAIALIENVQRENLNPIDEAIAIERLVNEFDLTHADIAKVLGKSRAAITNLLRLLTLPKEVKTFVENKDLELGHAKVLLGLPVQSLTLAARTVVAKELSVRETEKLVASILAEKSELDMGSKNLANKMLDPDIKRLQESLSAKVGAKINILHSRKGKGKIVIPYASLDELDGILEHIS